MRYVVGAVAFLLLSSNVEAADKQRLAVLDLEAKGVDPASASNMTDLVSVALRKLEVFEVITRADIQQMLSFEANKQMVGCSANSACLAELGGALGVARLVAGSVGKLGDGYVL